VAQALLKQDLVIAAHRAAYDAIAKWTVDGEEMLLKITDAGLRAIGVDPNAGDASEEDEQSAAAIARRNAERRDGRGGVPRRARTRRPRARRTPCRRVKDAPAPEAAQDAPVAPDAGGPAEDLALLDAALAAPSRTAKTSLRDAAAAVIAAWDSEANRETDMITALDGPMQALRTALAGKPVRAPRDTSVVRKPREGAKQ